MDNRALNPVLQTQELFEQMLLRVNTCIPGKVISFDSGTQTITAKPAINMRVTIEGVTQEIELPELHKVPLIFPFSSGFALTVPVKANMPCILIFSQRCIDEWWQTKAVSNADESGSGVRHHNINDALAILCDPTLPDVLGSWCQDGIEMRNKAGNVRITLRESAIEVEGPTTFLSPVTFNSTTMHKGIATFTAALIANSTANFNSTMTSALGVDMTNHKHTGVQGGSSSSGGPTS